MNYSISEARYSKGKFVIRIPPDGSGFKTDLCFLAESVGGKWVHRDKGYQVSAAQLNLFKFLSEKGFIAGAMIFAKQKPKFRLNGLDFTLAEVKKLFKNQ